MKVAPDIEHAGDIVTKISSDWSGSQLGAECKRGAGRSRSAPDSPGGGAGSSKATGAA